MREWFSRRIFELLQGICRISAFAYIHQSTTHPLWDVAERSTDYTRYTTL